MSETPDPNAERPLASSDPTMDLAADALVRVLDEYLAALKAGGAPTKEALLAAHPELAPQLEACLAGLEFLHSVEDSPSHAKRLGDFRLLREVGRGGMGAVFEAEQISLGRRVALKVLRFGGVSDKEAIERFRREAETVAKLHHTNIVPIFAVGTEQGVNYYAMQFIEGRSLADVLAQDAQPIDAEQVAEWGLQAAEALAHAHQRGVIHRDVKPSNLMLDREGRLWLTDFGLARRQDDVTLSLTGALLGTPRYMSPEQASATTKRVDHRSDLFSLGATLYELIASRPAFAGNTPHDVIQQILSGEPAPIRQFNRSAPRDLETIITKCLAKEPSSRYATAAELAADLRAFLDGRPIRARRAGPVERATRWAKKHHRSVRQAALAAGITLAVTFAGLFASNAYENAHQGSIRLDAVDPPLVAEFLDDDGDVQTVETLPMQNAAVLPAGKYQLRLSRDGMLSQSIDVQLDAGQRDLTYKVGLKDALLVAPRDIERSYDVAPLDGTQKLLEWTDQGVTVRLAHYGMQEWALDLTQEKNPALAAHPGYLWPWLPRTVSQNSGYGSYQHQPWVLREPFDADGDGAPDLIVAARHQAWLMAISGKGNGILWFAGRGENLAKPRANPNSFHEQTTLRGAVLDEPLTLPDLNQDGTPELLVSLVDIPPGSNPVQNTFACRRWVEAISGRTGETVWRYDLLDKLFDLPVGEDAPYAMRWFPNVEGGRFNTDSGGMHFGRHQLRGRGRVERSGEHVYRPDAPCTLTIAGEQRVAMVAGDQLVLLDAATGTPVEAPIALGFRPSRNVQWGDLDGDGAEDLLALEALVNPAGSEYPIPRVHAWSHARRAELWSKTLNADWPNQQLWSAEAPRWPLVADLNQDGVSEVLLPIDRSAAATSMRTGGGFSAQETPWCELAALDGKQGKPLWTRRLVTMDFQVDQFIAGPDLTGDGAREVFAATMAGPGATLYVDAIDGANGEILWTAKQPEKADPLMSRESYVVDVRLWNGGGDGLPLLLVRTAGENGGERRSRWTAIATRNGEIKNVGDNITDVSPADMDGDGVEDLVVYVSKSGEHRDHGGTLHVVRGMEELAWKQLGEPGESVDDLNDDGVRELVRSWGDGTLIATSGASGEELWRTRPIRAVSELSVTAAKSDLNGDGVPDLLVHERSTGGRGRVAPLHAISGQDGSLIWSIDDVAVRIIGGSLALQVEDLDGDGNQEVIWLAALDHKYPDSVFSSNAVQLWLYVVDGRNGTLKWSEAMSPAYGLTPGNAPFGLHDAHVELAFADLNQDGTLDLLAPAVLQDVNLELRALDGKSGQTLWRRSRPADQLGQSALQNLTSPTICDFEGDGALEVVMLEPSAAQQLPNRPLAQYVTISALSAADGEPKWAVPTDVVYTHFVSYGRHRGEVLRPQRLRASGGGELAAVFLPGGDQKLLVFGGKGLVTERTLHDVTLAPRMQVCDADGDGLDELLFIDRAELIAASPTDLDKPRWKFPLRTTGIIQLFEVFQTEPQEAVVAIAPDPADNTVFGLDARTGAVRWSCPGPMPRLDDVIAMPERIELLSTNALDSPLVYYQHSFVAECRRAKARGDVKVGAPRVVQRRAVDPYDPRWERELPWAIDSTSAGMRMAEFFGWSAFFSATLILLPGGYVVWLVRKRHFGLNTLFLLPVIAAVCLVGATVEAPIDNDFATFTGRLAVGLMLAPIWLALALLVRWSFNGRWRRVLFWACGVLVTAAVIGALGLAMYLQNSPLLPGERFDWSTWYHLLPPAAYATACLAVVATAAEWALRKLIRARARSVARDVRGVSQQSTVALAPATSLGRSGEKS